MTTKNSPAAELKAQADKIAKVLKDAEAGRPIPPQFVEKLKAARQRPTFKFGVVMDDKALVIEIPWPTISETPVDALSEWIVREMQEQRGGH